MFWFTQRRISPFLLVMILLSPVLRGQETVGNCKFSTGFAGFVQFSSVTDEKVSGLSFHGTIPGFSVRLKLQLMHAEHVLEAAWSAGSLHTDKPLLATATSKNLNLNYYNLFRVFQSRNTLFSLKAGGVLTFLFNQRVYDGFINTDGSFETILSAGGTMRLEYYFSMEENSFRISDQFTLPVLSYYEQPSFSGLTDGKNDNHSSQLVFIPQLLRLNNLISVEKPLNGSLLLSVFYNWDFYRIQSDRDVKNNIEQIGLSLRYTF